MDMMKWRVTKLKVDKELFNADGSSELVKAGTRILVCTENNESYVPSWKELNADEVKEEREQNECFGCIDIVYTMKGNQVCIYEDTETTELFFCVRKQGM